MKRIKLGITALAVMIGIGSAFATAHKNFSTVKWRPIYSGSTIVSWTNVNTLQKGSDYTCEGATQVCTAQFPSGTTPTASSPVPADHDTGVFTQ